MSELFEMVKAQQRAYLSAYAVGFEAGGAAQARLVSCLMGAIEDYLEGESQGNVTGLRQALEAARKAVRT
jgi:hypothetical protein